MSLCDALREHIISTTLKGKIPEGFSNDFDLIKNELLDSMDYLSLITHVEDHYHVELQEEDITPENFRSVTTLAKVIESKLS